MAGDSLIVNVQVTADGYVGQTVSVELRRVIPPGASETPGLPPEPEPAPMPPGHDMDM